MSDIRRKRGKHIDPITAVIIFVTYIHYQRTKFSLDFEWVLNVNLPDSKGYELLSYEYLS